MSDKKEIIFDVETKNLFPPDRQPDPAALGVSIVSVYQRTVDKDGNEIEGQIKSFWEKDFDALWPLFQTADRIIGFNTIGFDVPALQPYTQIPLKKLNHLDIHYELRNKTGRRISLNACAKESLNSHKTDVGINAVLYWQKGDPESLAKLQSYCEADVILTRDLYDYAKKHNHIKYKDHWNTPHIVELDFSYPETEEEQTSLF